MAFRAKMSKTSWLRMADSKAEQAKWRNCTCYFNSNELDIYTCRYTLDRSIGPCWRWLSKSHVVKIWHFGRAPFQEVSRKTFRLLLFSIKFGQRDSRSKIKQASFELLTAFHKAINDFVNDKRAPAYRQSIVMSPRPCAGLACSCLVVYSTNTTPQCQMHCYRSNSSVMICDHPNGR